MNYCEEYISRAYTVAELIEILSTLNPDASIEVSAHERSVDCEVWYDECTRTVILK